MCRQIFRILFAFLAVLVGSIGILLLTLRIQLFNPNTYKDSLREAEVYDALSLALDEGIQTELAKITSTENNPEDKNADDFGSELFTALANEIFKQLDITEVLQTSVEANINNVFAWANGKEDTIYIYFPRKLLVESVDNDKLQKSFLSKFQDATKDQLKKLPQCINDAEKQKTLKAITKENINFENISCTNKQVENKVDKELSATFAFEDDFNFIDEVIAVNLGDINEKTNINDIVEKDDYSKDIQPDLDKVKIYIDQSMAIIIILIITSLVFTLISVLLTTKNKWLIFSKIYLIVGLFLIFVGSSIVAMAKVNIDKFIKIEPGKIPVLLESQSDTIISTIKIAISSLINNLFSLTLTVGIILFLTNLLVLLIFMYKTYKQSKPNIS